jgi:hypothetical protein
VRILLDLKRFVFIHICKCGFYGVYGAGFSLVATWCLEAKSIGKSACATSEADERASIPKGFTVHRIKLKEKKRRQEEKLCVDFSAWFSTRRA